MSRTAIPFAVLFVGIVATVVVAVLHSSAALREQSLLFDQEVVQEHQRFVDEIESNLDDFEDAVSFMRATFPGTTLEYERFFEDSIRLGGVSNLNPGITLIEPVDLDEVDTFESREAVLGGGNFEIAVKGPLFDGRHHVVSRAAKPVSMADSPLVGLDIGSVAPATFEELDLPTLGRTISVLDHDSALGALYETPRDGADVQHVVILEAINHPETGEVRGWAAQFFDPLRFVRDLPRQFDPTINVSVSMLGVTELVASEDPFTPTPREDAALSRQMTGETHSLQWTLEMWSTNEDFAVRTGVLDQTRVWLTGLLATLGCAFVSGWRVLHEHKLIEATFELQHARVLAATDPLTGLLNRQGFIDVVDGLEKPEGGAVFFVDLDGFKLVNDSNGHAAGDRVLRDVAEQLREQFRQADVIGRFGGDEFVVYAPGLVNQTTAEGVSERVVGKISSVDPSISCSLGIAIVPPDGTAEFEEVLNQADAAMYLAKQRGGDRYQASVVELPG